MREYPHLPKQTWSIVLAGGDGGRIRGFIRRWLGRSKPKQYCAFVGGRSVFQHTLDRAAGLCAPEQIVTLVDREHRHEAWSALEGRIGGTVLLQPKHREIAAELYLSLTYVRHRDPRATVVIYPADHFVYPETRFLESVKRAAWTAEWLPDRVVLLGVSPDRLELDYGWITPGEKLDESAQYQIRAVGSFMAQPTAAQADTALAQGALWNTCVLAAKADTLWQIGWQCFPDLLARFERLSAAIGTPQEGRTLEEIYHDMPAHNFFTEFLERTPDRAVVIEMSGVLWSDWGKPQLITNTLRQIGRQPAFPLGCLRRPFVPNSLAVSEAGGAAAG
jgi:mannose-1-phosphate guanylyltransferase